MARPAVNSFSAELPCGPAAPQLARQFVNRAVVELFGRRAGSGQLVEDAQLVASELATNAVAAGCDMLTIEMHDDGNEVILDVSDDAGGWPIQKHAEPTDVSGRGLQIVDAVSLEWGVEEVPGAGKRVWAALPGPRRLSLA